jgi:hypothetical protein
LLAAPAGIIVPARLAIQGQLDPRRGTIVAVNRSERQPHAWPNTPVLSEVLRRCAESGPDRGGDRDETRLPLFWRVFGSTVLSITALVVLTAYQSLSGTIAELRSDVIHLEADLRKELGRMSEGQAELVKKEESSGRFQSVWRGIGELQGDRKELTALKERCRALVDAHRAAAAERRRLDQDVQAVREQKAQEEERRALARELAGLRERLAGLEVRQRGGVLQTRD